MPSVALHEARARLSELVGRAMAYHDSFAITVRGEPAAVLVSVDEFESMLDTLGAVSVQCRSGSTVGGGRVPYCAVCEALLAVTGRASDDPAVDAVFDRLDRIARIHAAYGRRRRR